MSFAAIETGVLVALIAAGASLITAIVAQLGNLRTRKDIAEQAERDARRDYEYEARKRLYEECEPLLFQAVELAAPAQSRVLSLARTARGGQLTPDGSGWLGGEGYYFMSTAYLLLAPVTSFRLLQTRLTGIDLGLDPRLRTQYELLKLLFLSFNADFDLARCDAPRALPYEPDRTDPGQRERARLLESDPARFARQGLYRGILDIVVEALITGDDAPRCVTFGEFLRDWKREDSELHAVSGELWALLGGFHPQRKPVLWRVLVTQYLLYTVLLLDRPLTDGALPELPLEPFDWRGDAAEAPDDEVREPLAAARTYVDGKLAEVRERLGARAA